MSVIHPHHLSRTQSPHVPRSLIFALPFDIECVIFDQLSDQFRTLRACSLVCRGWRSITGRHLFRSVFVDLYVGKGTRSIVIPCLEPKQLRRFLDFLHNNPDVATFVLNVRVRGGQGFLSSLGDFIPAVLSKAPNLHTMTLSWLSLGRRNVLTIPPVEPPVQSHGPFPPAAIDTLTISLCDFDGPRRLFDIFRHFSRIRQLKVSHSSLKPSACGLGVLGDLHPSAVPAIESVMLDSLSSNVLTVLYSALRASSLPSGTLQTIRCPVSESMFNEFLVPCLKGARGHLRELRLDIDSRASPQLMRFLLDCWHVLRPWLASCTMLESITVAVEGKRSRHREEAATAYMNALQAVFSTYYAQLVCPSPPAVRSIEFTLRERLYSSVLRDAVDAIAGGKDWDRLDAGLCEHQALSRVAFVFESSKVGEEMDEAYRARILRTLESKLPNLLAKGVLRVEQPICCRQAEDN